MRVLHLGAGNLFGGVETFFVTLAKLRHLAPDMESEYGLCFHGRLWDELTAAGVPVFDLGEVRVSRPWTVLRARKRLRQVMAERQYDVVVVHSGWGHLVFGPEVRRRRVRLTYFAHSPPDRPTFLDCWAARTRPDVVIANSRFTATSVPKLFPGVATEVVYLPVQVDLPADHDDTRAAVRQELGTPDSATVILSASRLERWKGQSLLLDALGQLRDRQGWEAWIAGGAQRPSEVGYLTELKATAERLGITDRVKFLGQRTDVPRLLVAADLHCQPNTGPEPFGLVFVEALAAGLPVVTTAIGGAVEIVNETCGMLVHAGDSAKLAEALGQLIADPALRRTLGMSGPRRAKELCEPSARMAAIRKTLASR